jgi:diguanylate cyclase (GGDEF)-like protein
MSFRFRLASLFVAALFLVQGVTAVLVYRVTRHELVAEGQRQLDVAARAFSAQLDDISRRVASSVQVLALDFALRSAIAQHDQPTVLSALGNHGRRVGATRMLLVDVEGNVQVDTAGRLPAGAKFPFASLVSRAAAQPASAIAAWDQRAYWVVAVPVYAPDLIGFIAAAIPLDHRLLLRLQQQSALPKSIELATPRREGGWQVIASGGDSGVVARGLGRDGAALPTRPQVVDVAGREYVVQAVDLSQSGRDAAVVAVLAYSVDAALEPYRAVAIAWGALLALGLLGGVAGAWLIARSVSRPVEELAAAARRIAAGDYTPPPAGGRQDELGELAGTFASMTDALRDREAKLLHQAGHDLVTGLPNRIAAEIAIQQQLDEAVAPRAALLMLGLGRLPDIITTMGHVVADRVMREIAQRLVPVAGDALVARATDARFSLFCAGSTRGEAVTLALRIVEALSEPYREADLTLDLSPAIGIACSPVHGAQASTLMRRADIALIGALGSEEPVAMYDPATDPHRPERLSLMADLRHALESREGLSLAYQPKLHLASGRIDGAEALVRWQHPSAGPLAPDVFIALAEETGNIRRLTRWVLEVGIEQAARWQASGLDLRVALNVSARDLDDIELPRRVAGLLAAHGLSPRGISLEVTESAIMAKPETAVLVLRRLADLGLDIAIDDFGVGQSSFAYLRRLPVRELKIDRSFVTRIAQSREDLAIVRSIIDLAGQLGFRVTAEGVEDAATLERLRALGCDHAQGFGIARPMPAQAFEAFFDARKVAEA